MKATRVLIVNADDFGQSAGINRGIIQAHQHGIVTSTSLMVRWPAAIEARALSRHCPELAVGLHLDFGERFLDAGEWIAHYEVVSVRDRRAVQEEIERQLATFRQLIGRHPTHIDSHQHVHLQEPVRSIVQEKAQELGVPLRRCHPGIQYCGDFYGQGEDGSACHERITIKAMLTLLANLRPGITELCCHPAAFQDLYTMYAAEREQELQVLCDTGIREAIEGLKIELCSYRNLPAPHQ